MVGRSTEEWIAKHPDQKVPPRVRLRIFNAHDGRCYLTGRKIMAGERWDLEHRIALHAGGEHRESNMAPALVAPHKEKTKAERKIKQKLDRVAKKHLGIRAPSKFPNSRDGKWKTPLGGRTVLRGESS